MTQINLQNPSNCALHGGPAVFTERLKKAIVERGLFSEEKYNCWMNLAFRPIPEEVLNRKPRIVIRFDGSWNLALWPFWGCDTQKPSLINQIVYKRINRQIFTSIKMADAFILQSEFSREMIERLCGTLPELSAPTIHNGVDLELFSPAEAVRPSPELRIIISHKHWAIKRSWLAPRIIAELKAALKAASGSSPASLPQFGAQNTQNRNTQNRNTQNRNTENRKKTEVKVRVLGSDTPNPIPGMPGPLTKMKQSIKKLGLTSNVEFRGHIEAGKLPDEYRWADIMLNLSFADPCPNVVVEALASGLPVVGPKSGGLAELVDQKDWLVDSNEDALGLYNPYVYAAIPGIKVHSYVETIKRVCENLNAGKAWARKRAEEKFNINYVVNRYIEVLEGSLSY